MDREKNADKGRDGLRVRSADDLITSDPDFSAGLYRRIADSGGVLRTRALSSLAKLLSSEGIHTISQLEAEHERLLDLNAEELGLSERIIGRLESAGLGNLRQIVACGDDVLIADVGLDFAQIDEVDDMIDSALCVGRVRPVKPNEAGRIDAACIDEPGAWADLRPALPYPEILAMAELERTRRSDFADGGGKG